jgi:hypothetical protein
MVGTHRFRIALVATVLVAATGAAQAQDTEITGARFTLVQKSEPSLSVTLENLRDAPLVFWQIAIRDRSDRPVMTHWSDRTMPTARYSPDDGPVVGHTRRVETIQLGNADGLTAVISLAVFADGFYEGPGADEYLQRRRGEADDLKYWIAALQNVARAPDADVQRLLKEQLAERAGQMKDSSFASNLRYLVDESVPRSPESLRSALAQRRIDAQTRLTFLDHPMTPGPLQRAADVTSVGITSTRTTTGQLYGVVENLRDVSIEAVGIARYNALSEKLESGVTSDFGEIGDATAGHGSIQPGERRELALNWNPNPDGSLPNIKLRFVLFGDLKSEGSIGERESLLKARERRAADASYWIPVLKAAAAQPPEQARKYLETKKRERAAALAVTQAGSPGTQQTIDNLLDSSRTADSKFGEVATRIAAELERQRLQLTRHLSR